ncbi:MAG: beta-propeller domain-containing protein, partial [Agathobacter sp.]|nr:beta-propeller domain-containing protein [Agathobacter sp.]
MEEKRKDQGINAEELQMEELLRRIEETSEDIRVPASLEPEAVKARLRAGGKQARRIPPMRRLANAAAVVALVAAMGGVAGIYGTPDEGCWMIPNDFAGREQGQGIDDAAADGPGVQVIPQKKEIVGDYRLASDYQEVLAALENSRFYRYFATDEGMADGWFVVDEAETALSGSSAPMEVGVLQASDLAEKENAVSDQNSRDDADYSKTNLQVDGVDESDFIKNDGNYLYVQSGEEVH